MIFRFIVEKWGQREARGLAKVIYVTSQYKDQKLDQTPEPRGDALRTAEFQPGFCLKLYNHPPLDNISYCISLPLSLPLFSLLSLTQYFLCTCCLLSIAEVEETDMVLPSQSFQFIKIP